MDDKTSISADAGIQGPPVVYLPVLLDDQGEVSEIRMIQLADGRVALLGYTALDRLIDCCGEQQPWLLVDAGKLGELRDEKPYDVKFLDVALPDELRFGGGQG